MSDVSTAVSTADYARIYEEQQPRLVAYARSLTRNAHTAEDLVAEAHFRVWRRLAAGHRIDNVPAYLMTTLRHLASAAGSAVRETPLDPQAGEQAEAGRHGDDPAEHVSSVDMVVRVLGQLPERWVKALWLAEAEGQPLAAIGPQLGTKEGATAVLLHRAREGMRLAFLRTQTGAPDDPACQVHWARMPAYVRGSATARQSERLLGHVDACDDCRARLAALMSANNRLPALVGPALLVFAVGGTGKFLLGFAGTATAFGGSGGGLLDGVRHGSVGVSKAAAAAGAVVVGAAAVFLALGPVEFGSIPAQRQPVAEGPVAEVPVAEAPATGDGVEGGGKAEGAADVQPSVRVRVEGASGGATGVTEAEEGPVAATPSPTRTAPPEEPGDATPGDTDPAPPTTGGAGEDPEAPAPPVDDSPKAPEPPVEEPPKTPEPPVADPPKTPEPPAEDPPKTPIPPTEQPPTPPAPPAEEPGHDSPEAPTPPVEGTPEPGTPSAPTPDPTPDPGPSTPVDPQPVEDPSPTPADPRPAPADPDPTPVAPPVEDPTPVAPPVQDPSPATPPTEDPAPTAPSPADPPTTTDPGPAPVAPGDDCADPTPGG
ncbi:RNA polymerase sigma factor (sigma-70 family) [Streptomyces canus]|uniref:sigma factor n=1 Tax=Streptomyces canus TaxID=58343 RepID=UPI002786039C|nr:sigma factor [Streptomyces canus]MDQ0599775.1 RNA polymerase sigma factor (sigma-70 family) [Streptomyces canus]